MRLPFSAASGRPTSLLTAVKMLFLKRFNANKCGSDQNKWSFKFDIFLRRWHLSNFNTFWLLDLTSVSYCKGLDQSFELFCTASLDMHTFVLLAITITNKRHICNEECRLPGAAAGWAWPQPCTPSPVGEASLSCRPSPRWPVAAVGQAAQRS